MPGGFMPRHFLESVLLRHQISLSAKDLFLALLDGLDCALEADDAVSPVAERFGGRAAAATQVDRFAFIDLDDVATLVRQANGSDDLIRAVVENSYLDRRIGHEMITSVWFCLAAPISVPVAWIPLHGAEN